MLTPKRSWLPLLVASVWAWAAAGADDEWQIVGPDTTILDLTDAFVRPGELLLLNPDGAGILPLVEHFGGAGAKGIGLTGFAIDRLSGDHAFFSIDTHWDGWQPGDVIRCEFSGSNCTLAFSSQTAGVPDGVKISALATAVSGGVQTLYLSFDTTFKIGATVFRPADVARWNGSVLSLALATEASGAVSNWDITGMSLRPDASWQLAFDLGARMPFPGGIQFFTSDVLRANPTVNAYVTRLRARSLDWEGARISAWDALDCGLTHFNSFSVIVNHNTNPATLTVYRNGGNEGRIRLNYTTIAGGAQPGVDYVNTSGTLTWNHGDATQRQIQIPILNTAGSGIDKSFDVILFPDNLWALTKFPHTVTLTIPNVDVIFRDSYE